jgi:hypothetical protein
MRIVTWNCCRGDVSDKLVAAEHWDFQVLLLQECPQIAQRPHTAAWVGAPGKLGVGVITRGEYAVHTMPQRREVPQFMVPFYVDGPVPFTLHVVWTVAESHYIRGLNRGLDVYAGDLEGKDAIISGDFNSNARWDGLHPRHLNHSAMLAKMERIGLASAYHTFTGEKHGEEREATFFHHFKKDKPHHIDYCFIPKAWYTRLADVKVGAFDSWRRFSDHCPLMVELAE